MMAQPGSHSGAGGFIIQRATSVVLIPLCLWLLYALIGHVGAEFDAVASWMAEPANAFLLASFVGVSALHMRGGMADVILDYFDGTARQILRLLNTLVAIGVVAASWWALFQLVF